MPTISIIVITKNEEERIADCLESVKWVDEIVLVDSFSNDKTEDIASKFTEKIYKREFDDFASQKNFALEKTNCEWILNIDADERISRELKKEILKILTKDINFDAFEIPIKTYFLGKAMKYAGEFPSYRTRLFKNKFKFHNKVHEELRVKPKKLGRLEQPIEHYTCLNLKHYINKYVHYAKLSAQQKYEAGEKKGLFYAALRFFLDFFQKYILQRGILMGGPGFIYSAIRAYYSFLKYVFLWELNNQ